MLYIKFFPYEMTTEERTYHWQVGQDLPNISVHQVFGIQADDEEADFIEEMMGGGINRVTPRYYGDLARTIFLNLDGEPLPEDDEDGDYSDEG